MLKKLAFIVGLATPAILFAEPTHTPESIPSLSEWGLIILGLLLLIAAIIMLARVRGRRTVTE